MKKFYLLLAIVFSFSYTINAQDWVFAEQFASTGTVKPVDIKIDGTGDIYIVGTYTDALTIGGLTPLPNSGSDDIFICKFNSNGTALWAKQIGGDGKDIV
ncbi:hypothetical protein LCGC14_3098090, partial [marine sediment metagenome]